MARGASDAVAAVFARLRLEAEPDQRSRVDAAEADLLRCFDLADGTAPPAEEVLAGLPYFLLESELTGCDAEDLRLRLRLTLELSRRLTARSGSGPVELLPAQRDLEVAWTATLRRLRRSQGVSGV